MNYKLTIQTTNKKPNEAILQYIADAIREGAKEGSTTGVYWQLVNLP